MHTYNLGTKLLIVINRSQLRDHTLKHLNVSFIEHKLGSVYPNPEVEPSHYNPQTHIGLIVDGLSLYHDSAYDSRRANVLLHVVDGVMRIERFVHHEANGSEYATNFDGSWLYFDPNSGIMYPTAYSPGIRRDKNSSATASSQRSNLRIYELLGSTAIIVNRMSSNQLNQFCQVFATQVGRSVNLGCPEELSEQYDRDTEICMTTSTAITREEYPDYLTLLDILHVAFEVLGIYSMTLRRHNHTEWQITRDGQFRITDRRY